MTTVRNIVAVARREYTVRVRTRSFVVGTIFLIVAVLAIAFAPIIVRRIDQTYQQRIAIHVAAADLRGDPVATLTALLNASTDTGTSGSDANPDFVVNIVPDLAAARQAVGAGEYAAALEIGRTATGDVDFTLYTNDNATGRTAALIRQASTAIAIGDRLSRAGVEPAVQAGLFAPAAFAVEWPDPARSGPTRGTNEMAQQDMLSFGMTILIFMMIVMYGTWVATSVVEEKSSRVMEVILNAATPFQLLSGKVLGVGAIALTQYAALLAAGALALLAQGPVATAILGATGGAGPIPAGLTMEFMVMFGIYGTLGFLLFAVLYAAAGSLVSRQEDVNAVVLPMTLVATAGYMVGVYAAMGLLDIKASWMVVVSQIPLVSPFMMLGRITTGEAAAWEVVLSITLLVVSIVGALWLASRIYAAGVLLYGQRPGVRSILRLVRSGT
jgi:ABC-2 type transport system permease protein